VHFQRNLTFKTFSTSFADEATESFVLRVLVSVQSFSGREGQRALVTLEERGNGNWGKVSLFIVGFVSLVSSVDSSNMVV